MQFNMETIIKNPLTWTKPFLIALIIIKWAYSKLSGNKHLYNWKDFLTSTSMSLGVLILNPIFKDYFYSNSFLFGL